MPSPGILASLHADLSPTTSPAILYPATPGDSPAIAQRFWWNRSAPEFVPLVFQAPLLPVQVPVVCIYNYLEQSHEVFHLPGRCMKVGDLQYKLYLASRGHRARDLKVRGVDGGHLGKHELLDASSVVMLSKPMQVHVSGCGLVKCWPHDPVMVLHRAVALRCGTLPEDQILLYNGKILQPHDARLCSFGLRHGSGIMASGRLHGGGGGGLDDPEGDFDAAVDEEMLDAGACGSCDGPFTAPEELPDMVGLAAVQHIVDPLSWAFREYLYHTAAISDREFDDANPYLQACINRYIDDRNAAFEGEAAAVQTSSAMALVAPTEDRARVGPGGPRVADSI